jgi:hypothetical protein
MDYHNCPECGLHSIQQRKTAQTVGQVLGAVGGIAVGMLFPFSGSKLPITKLPQQGLPIHHFCQDWLGGRW